MLIEKNVKNKRKSWYICDRCGEKLTGISRNLISVNNTKKGDLCSNCCNLLIKSISNKNYLKDLKVHKRNKTKIIKESRKRTKYDYSEEKINFLADNVTALRLADLTELFNRKFNCNLTKIEIKRMKDHLKLRSGLDTRAKKGVAR